MNIGGNYKLVNFGLYLLMTAALTWSIVYLCSFYKIEEVLQFAAMLFASSFGLCVYSNAANSDFSDNFDAYGGIQFLIFRHFRYYFRNIFDYLLYESSLCFFQHVPFPYYCF